MPRLSRRATTMRPPLVLKAAALVDDFRSMSTTRWRNSNEAVVRGWRLVLTPPEGGQAFVSTDTARYDLTNSKIHAEFTVLPTAATSSTYMMARQSFSPDTFVFIGREGPNLLMREAVDGVASDTTITYDAVEHRWVRLRHSGTSLMWETSNNGIAWTTRRTGTTNVDLSSVMMSIETAWYTAPTGVGRAEIANVNVVPYKPPAALSMPPRYFGTLVTRQEVAVAEFAGGCRIATQDQAWSVYETADNAWNGSEKAIKVAELAALRAAGYVVSLSMGHHHTPAYVAALPGGLLVNEDDTESTQANLVFCQTTRSRMERYMSRLHTDLDLNRYWSIRISAAGNGEMIYPHEGWWAYDDNAQGNDDDLPATVPPCPYPGWKPGEATITVAQAAEWLEWYLDALVDSANWQMKYLRDLGFTGWFELLIPGNGTRPSTLADDLNNHRLQPGAWETATGAVWHKVIQRVTDRRGVICYCTSVADVSGDPLYNVTEAADAAVAITNPTADTWSAARWIARLGREYGMPLGGENPGLDPTINSRYIDNSSSGLMAKCFEQAAAADYMVFNWAHSDKLHDGTVPFSEYSSRISEVNGASYPLPPAPPA